MLKRIGAAAACERAAAERHVARDHGHEPGARRAAGSARTIAMSEKSLLHERPFRTVPETRFAVKGRVPLPNTILTPVKRLLLLVSRGRGRRRAGRAGSGAGDGRHRACSRSTSARSTSTRSRRTGSTSQLDRAEKDGYDAVVIVLDTPGGLSDVDAQDLPAGARREDPGDRLRRPDGARAASAGVWISQAADVLAMAPQTNIGSSTPINSSGAEHQHGPAPQGGQRRGRVAARAREEPRPQRDVGRRRGAQGVEPDRRARR